MVDKVGVKDAVTSKVGFPPREMHETVSPLKHRNTLEETRAIIKSCIMDAGQARLGNVDEKLETESQMKLETESEIKLQNATNRTREILSTCVMEEGMTSAVEFLSVECDMIFEPDCDLETDDQVTEDSVRAESGAPFVSHFNTRSVLGHQNSYSSDSDAGCQEDGCSNEASTGMSNGTLICHSNSSRLPFVSPTNGHNQSPSDVTPPPVYHLPLIGDLFRRRGVVVYKRSSRDSPFVKIYHPDAHIPSSLKNGRLNHSSRKHGLNGGNESEGGETKLSKKDRSSKDTLRGRNPSIFKCGKCRKQFTSKTCLLTHRLVHSKRTGDSYVCPVCEGDFTNKVSLRLHIQRKICLRDVQNQFRDRKHRQSQTTGSRSVSGSENDTSKGTINPEVHEIKPMKSSKSGHKYDPTLKPKSHSKSSVHKLPAADSELGQTSSSGSQERTHGTKSHEKALLIAKTMKPHATKSSKIVALSDCGNSKNTAPQNCTNNKNIAPSSCGKSKIIVPSKCGNCGASLTHSTVQGDQRHSTSTRCDKCGASNKHKHKRSHRERKSYECPECGSQYRKSSALKKHRRLEHDVT